MTDASIALNRFGLGARPDEPAPTDGRRWLLDQFGRFEARPAAIAGAAASATVSTALAQYFDEQRQLRRAAGGAPGRPAQSAAMPVSATAMQGMTPMQPAAGAPTPGGATPDALMVARRFAGQQAQQYYGSAVAARTGAALLAPAPFVERLVHFWANHFAVSADKLEVIGLAPTLEFEAIRPHVLGKFGDMLGAVERHPAMLLYLDQAQSVGPNSPIGARAAARAALQTGPQAQRRIGLNENLAREIMELHTLGVRTGYAQADVTEFARALTGWSVAGLAQGAAQRFTGTAGQPGSFVFAAPLHEPGDRTIMGRRYPQDGERQAQAVLDTLATHPATAQHVATKLARHFAGDTPPPAMVARLQTAFLRSGGDLPTVYRALIASPEAWVAGPVKFRTPWEWAVGSLRALGYRETPAGATVGLLNQLGQPLWRPGSPAGYDDIAGSWAGPDAVLRRVEAAERLASRAGPIDARALGDKLFPASLSPATAQAVARAESPGQALALLLVSPDMMRR
ncbi:DUF1800 domain-containing protein [Sphingomonas sp.]|uniref:DUF1800 domain-containing protein n=1 Tax=Sphingomonas sp. TaxID=28214 RepID=UPI003CC6015C